MKYALFLCLLLGGCGTHRKLAPAAPPQSEPIGAALPAGDTEFIRTDSDNPAENGPSRSNVVVQPGRSLLDKVLGRNPQPYTLPAVPAKVGKKSTVNVYYGPATVSTTTVAKKATAATAEGATATAIDKAKGPTAIGDGAAAQDYTKQGQRGGAAASGAGATATATTVKPGLPWGRIAAGVVGGGFVIWLLFFGGVATLWALWRRNKPNPNQA